MRIDERILTRHLEAAAVEQLRGELEADGFEVRTDVRLDDGGQPVFMDLVACRGQERVFYEIKVLGEGRPSATKQLSRLAQAARNGGGEFRVALVRPGRRTEVAVAGIEEALRRALSGDPTGELGKLGQSISVEDVSGIEIERIEVRQGGEVEVAGAAVMVFSHSSEGKQSEPGRWSFPFAFRVTIGPDGFVLADPLPEYNIDLTEWYGNEPNEWE